MFNQLFHPKTIWLKPVAISCLKYTFVPPPKLNPHEIIKPPRTFWQPRPSHYTDGSANKKSQRMSKAHRQSMRVRHAKNHAKHCRAESNTRQAPRQQHHKSTSTTTRTLTSSYPRNTTTATLPPPRTFCTSGSANKKRPHMSKGHTRSMSARESKHTITSEA